MRNIIVFLGVLFAALASTPGQAEDKTMGRAILAGGCFWCLQSDFLKLDGVTEAVSGYSGGTIPNPTYQNYHDDVPGHDPHVEVVQVDFNTSKLSYEAVLDYFFRHIDPTDNGGQFCDRGAAYRPVVYYGSEAERITAERKKAEVAKLIGQPVLVDVLPATAFWAAEDYHQNYHLKNPVRYKYYRWNCGRDQKVQAIWGGVTKE